MFEFIRNEIRYLLILIRLKFKKSSDDIIPWNCYYRFYDDSSDGNDENNTQKQDIFGIVNGECLGGIPVSVVVPKK